MIEGLKLEGGQDRERERDKEREGEIGLTVANRNSLVASLRCNGGSGNELAAADALI